MGWFNQNAGAVQAISAAVTVILTFTLIGVTCWYAALTRRMVLTMERQLAASVQPDTDLKLINGYSGSSGHKKDVSGTIVVANKGNVPVKVIAVAMKLVFDNNAFPDQSTTIDAQQRVVAPGKTAEFRYLTLQVPSSGANAKYEQFAQIHCSDLAGISRHTFKVSERDENVINQSLGFQAI